MCTACCGDYQCNSGTCSEILGKIFSILFLYILNESENATLQLSIFYEKVLDKKYLLKLNNVA